MTNFKELRTQNISEGILSHTYSETQPLIDLTSPALTMVNNFTQKDPLRAHFETTIVDALKQITSQHTGFILVVDDQEKLLGIASSADLQSSKIMILAQRLNISRAEISLRHVMTPLSHLTGVSMQSLGYACVGDALQTMEQTGMMFLLVTTAHNEICGLISAREIAKTLQIPVHISPIAHSFSEVMEHIEHPH
ncbi:MAG: CBS domain-containing protein [Pseudoalteromonas prydzensis]|uniref:CBS domain-containing protein n=1 Tax=Pseudoalteromonas prydzensis TaxID=182141 RepID=UPI003F9C3129